jgi:CO/xanthine dehydrogenase FAD-binding subunit
VYNGADRVSTAQEQEGCMGGSPIGAADVIVAASRAEAIDAFGDGAGVAVLAGGTIVMPEITHGRLDARRVVLIGRAGLSGVAEEGDRTVIGAGTTLAEVQGSGIEPLATVAGRVADLEIREQATIGGNLCAPPGVESPRGDLQAALLVLDAQVRSAGAGGERSEPVEDVLASPGGRLVLDVAVLRPDAAAVTRVRRPHAHAYTVLQVCAARADGELRVAVSGAGPRAVRLRAVEEAVAGGADAASAGERALDDVTPHDDALASAWYRGRVLPVLVRDALNDLG